MAQYALELWIGKIDRRVIESTILRNLDTQKIVKGRMPPNAHFEKAYACDENGRVTE